MSTATATEQSNGFTLHTLESAPAESKPWMEQAQAKFGLLPNLQRVMAEAPTLLEGYLTLFGTFSRSSFTPAEQQVVYQASNFVNGCHYCLPAHAMLSKMTDGLSDEDADRLKRGEPVGDARLEALRQFAKAMVEQRGHASDEQLKAFLEAGFSRQQALEIAVGAAVKVMSNFTNALANTPIDDAFKHEAD